MSIIKEEYILTAAAETTWIWGGGARE